MFIQIDIIILTTAIIIIDYLFFLCLSQDATAAVRRPIGAFRRPALDPPAVHVPGRGQHHRVRVEHQPGRPIARPAVHATASTPVAAAPAAPADRRPSPHRPHQPVTVHVTATAGAAQTVHVIQPASPADHRRLVTRLPPTTRTV